MSESNNSIHKCPICLSVMNFYTLRYPKAVCKDCTNKDIKDNDGNSVTHNNIDIYGGFISLHSINDEIVKKEDHICWINNIKCYAEEARFGGIVIQTYDERLVN